MAIHLINCPESLNSFKKQWDLLADRMRSPLLGFNWIYSAAKILHSDDTLFVFVYEEKSIVKAIAPLILANNEASPTFQNIGVSHLYEPADWLYDSEESITTLLQEVLNQGYPLNLLRMPSQSLACKQLKKLHLRKGACISRPSAAAYYLSLPDGSDHDSIKNENEIWQLLSSKRRYDFKRKRRCLAKQGNVSTRTIIPDDQSLAQELPEVMRIEDANWKGKENSSLLKNSALRAFFELFTQLASKDEKLRIFYLLVEEQAIAMHLTLQQNNALWVLKLGHDEAYSKCSPGILMAMETILYSARSGLERYEFLGSAEKWQSSWPVSSHELETCLFIPFNWRGFKFVVQLMNHMIKKRLSGRNVAHSPNTNQPLSPPNPANSF